MNRPEPESPCIRQCTLDPNDVCIGCFRTLAEIIGWSGYSAEEKRAVITNAGKRKREHVPPAAFPDRPPQD